MKKDILFAIIVMFVSFFMFFSCSLPSDSTPPESTPIESVPTPEPTAVPTAEPTEAPTAEPTEVPTAEPTEVPTAEPTLPPTEVPTAEPTPVPTAVPTIAPSPEIHYDGEHVGTALTPKEDDGKTYSLSYQADIRIRPADIHPGYVGKHITSVRYHITSRPSNLILNIYNVATIDYPGTPIYTQSINTATLTTNAWNEVILDTPLLIDSDYYWVGFEITVSKFSTGVIGIDAGPANPDGAYYRNSTSWKPFNIGRNLNIRVETAD
jgi:hypothetical protein